MTTYQGKCYCGQTEWEAKLEKDQASHILCHCNVCKALSGSTYTMNQIIPKANFKLTKGGEALKSLTYYGESGEWPRSPGKPFYCYYCPNCTAHPYHHQTVLGDDKITLRTSLLNKGHEFPVAAEIFGKDKWGWEKEVAQTFETLPPS